MKAVLKLLGIGAVGVLVVLALIPWTLHGADRRNGIRTEIEARTGLAVRIGGPIKVKLLPRPRIQIAEVSITARDGAMMVDAPLVYGDLDIPEILAGRLRMTSAALSEPTLTIDLDAGSLPAALLDTRAASRFPLPFQLSLRSAVVRLKSLRAGFDTLLTEVSATAARGSGPEGDLTLSGAAVWHGAREQFTLALSRPDLVLRGDSSPVRLQVTSPFGAFLAAGDLTGGPQPQFTGRLSASTAALPHVLSAFDLGKTWIKVQRASLSGEAVAKPGDLSLSDCALRFDDTAFEGTLGIHSEGGRSLVEGTLATNLLDVDKLAGRRLDKAAFASLYDMPFADGLAAPNLDLRISAVTALIGRTEVQDAAFSTLFRDGRLEVTVNEARAYAGLLKARTVATIDPSGTSIHGDLALSGVDIGALSTAWSGRESMTGIMSGRLMIDGRGNNFNELVHALTGDGKATVENGQFVGVSVSQALKRLARKLPFSGGEAAQITTFASASAGIGIAGGVARLVDGMVIGPGIRLEFDGRSELPRGNVEIAAVAAQTDAAGTIVPDGVRLPFEMRGTWGAPFEIVQRGRSFTLPSWSVPSFTVPPGLP